MINALVPASDDEGFGHATRVEETGLAVVHENEWIIAPDDSQATLVDAPWSTVIEVPIEIEVSVALTDTERRAIADLALRDLRSAFEARGGVG